MSRQTVDKRCAILDATLSMLSRRGFHGFSMKELAQEAGVAAGTIYLYFKDKNHLIEMLHEDLLQRIANDFLSEFDSSASLKDQFELFCRNYWSFCMREPAAVLSKAQFDHLPPEVLVSQRNFAREQWFAPVVNLFEVGRSQGVFKDIPDEILVSLSFEALLSLATKVHLGVQVVNDEQFEITVQACWDAVTCHSHKP